jgi:hypothetical protein
MTRASQPIAQQIAEANLTPAQLDRLHVHAVELLDLLKRYRLVLPIAHPGL